MDFPTSFKCAGQTIKVIVEEFLPNNDYGYWDDATNEIHIAKNLKTSISELDTRTVKLTESQLQNTYYHELMHCFQFYYDNSASEAMAQSFANMICEFQNTKQFDE